jgi:Zn-dependent protease
MVTRMFKSRLKIGSPFGIDLYIHWTFWLSIFYVIQQTLSLGGGTHDVLFGLAMLAGVFTCIVLHELGHCMAARAFGIKTHDIILSPIGGMARLERMPERPHRELIIAIAGPAVNVAIAVLLGGVVFAQKKMGFGFTSELTGFTLVEVLLICNIMLVAFNLIPAFPMDGGRVLRAFLGWFVSRVDATNIAATLGKVVAVFLGITALLTLNFVLVFIAVFIFLAGEAERRQVLRQDQLREQWRQHQAWQQYHQAHEVPVEPVVNEEFVPRSAGENG